MKRKAKWLTLFLSLVMVMNCLTFYGAGDVILPDDEAAASDMEIEIFDEATVGEEIVEWREEGVRHYYLGDGIYQAVVSVDVDDENVASPAATTPDSNAVEDTYISSSEANAIYGSSDKLWVSDTQTAYVYCEPPTLPDNAYIESAKLYFSYYYNISTGLLSLGAYQVNCPWRENTLTWNIANQYDNLGTSAECLGTASLYGTTTTTRGYVTITNAVKSWYETKELTSYGISLKRRSGTNNSVILLSSESGSTTAPSMVITYSLASLPIESGTYYIQNAIEYLLDTHETYWACFMQTNGNISGVYDSEDDPVEAFFCEMFTINGESQQKWIFEYLHNGYYVIKNVAENKVLSVQEGKENSANEIFVCETFTGDTRQQWKISLTNNGSYKIKPRTSEAYTTDWVMGISYDTPCIGKNVKQIIYDGTNAFLNDEWYLLPVGGDVGVLAMDDGRIPIMWIPDLLEDMSGKGYDKFNIKRKSSFTVDEITTQMASSTIYISMIHGGYDSSGTYIIIENKDYNPNKLVYTDLYGANAQVDLSNCELILFLSCYVGYKDELSLCQAALLAGAERVIGFKQTIQMPDAIEWMNLFLEYYTSGLDAYESCQKALDEGNYDSPTTIRSATVFPIEGGNGQ